MATLMDSVARFCDLRDLLELAHVCARWHGVREIAQVLEIARDAASGGEAIEEIARINEASWNVGQTFAFAPMREINRADLAERAIVLFATRYGGRFAHIAEQLAQHRESRALAFARALRGEDGLEEASKYGTWRVWLAVIFANDVRTVAPAPSHYELIDKYIMQHHNVESTVAVIAQLMLVNASLSQFAECVADMDMKGARKQMPQLRDATIRFICENRSMVTLEMLRLMRAPKFAMGPKFVQRALLYAWSTLAYEQFDIESPTFREKIAELRESARREKLGSAAPCVGARVISSSIIHAAKNPDPRAFELVYEIVHELREFCGVCEVMQNDEDFEVIQRAVARLESKGMVVHFGEYIINSFRHQRIPRFANVVPLVDLILSRSARGIAESKYPFQSEAVRFFARVSYMFGSRVARVIEHHFADYPSILARIRGYSRDSA